jgi:hypothetical protein
MQRVVLAILETVSNAVGAGSAGQTGSCDLMRDTRYSRFKVRIPAESSWTFCAGVVPDLTTGGTL